MTEQQVTQRLKPKILGCLLGSLIGDAMGAPGESKTYQQIAEMFGELSHCFTWRKVIPTAPS